MALLTNVTGATHGSTSLTGLLRVNYTESRVIKRSPPADGATTPTIDDVGVGGVNGSLIFNTSTGAKAFQAAAAKAALTVTCRPSGGGTSVQFVFANAVYGGSQGNLPNIEDPGMSEITVPFQAESLTMPA